MSAQDSTEGDASRAAFRAFVRTHHPDVGGDPDEFMAGLAEFSRAGVPEADPDDPRYDAPISFVVSPKGVARVRQWRRRRRRPPRVS